MLLEESDRKRSRPFLSSAEELVSSPPIMTEGGLSNLENIQNGEKYKILQKFIEKIKHFTSFLKLEKSTHRIGSRKTKKRTQLYSCFAQS